MPEIGIHSETVNIALTLVIVIATLYGFVSERLPADVTALLALLALLLTGILTPAEAFAGFSHPATVSVAAVLVLSAGIERTGALTFLARRVLTRIGRSELMLTIIIMVVISLLSAFINNTAAVAVFIPVVIEVCRRNSVSPSRLLMPMAHAATFGGMCTLIGTSTNLVSHEFALSRGLPGFSMFELGKVGLPLLIVGYAYILLWGRRSLPDNEPGEELTLERDEHYFAEMIISAQSSLVGRQINAEHFGRDYDLELVNVIRHGKTLPMTSTDLCFVAHDSILVRGRLDRLLTLAEEQGLKLHRPQRSTTTAETEQSISDTPARSERLPLAEVVVLTTSGLVGQTLRSAGFAERYDATVLALRRRGHLDERPSALPLHAGDMLVVEGEPDALKRMARTKGFLVIATPAYPDLRPGKLLISILTLIAVVLVVTMGLLPIVTAATAGCAVLLVTRTMRPREVYQAIDLSLVFLLAGSLALGAALQKSGATLLLASGLAGLKGGYGPFIVMASFLMVSMIISELMSNNGTVALLAPVALSVADSIGMNAMSLLAAVTFGASAAFAMPIGYQTSLMIYGPGGYRFRDFVKMGIPLDLILALLALILIPHFWPL